MSAAEQLLLGFAHEAASAARISCRWRATPRRSPGSRAGPTGRPGARAVGPAGCGKSHLARIWRRAAARSARAAALPTSRRSAAGRAPRCRTRTSGALRLHNRLASAAATCCSPRAAPSRWGPPARPRSRLRARRSRSNRRTTRCSQRCWSSCPRTGSSPGDDLSGTWCPTWSAPSPRSRAVGALDQPSLPSVVRSPSRARALPEPATDQQP